MHVQFDPVFFWNALFDKGLLAGIVLLLGYVLNRQLERVRANFALSSEAAKIRLTKIGGLWEEMSVWESDAKRTYVDFCHTMLEELRAVGLALPPLGDSLRESAIDTLIALGDIPIPNDISERVDSVITPQWEELARRAKDIWAQLHRSRFWLKDDLFIVMGDYCIDMQRAATLLVPTPEGAVAGLAAFKALANDRENIDEVLLRLLDRHSKRSPRSRIPSRAP
ncbi:MAG: hypothetical protein JWM95_2360 [Gemmatimonadetes bacterium]|nr:hypothetical protein [Gemmatimonadota bacterium]